MKSWYLSETGRLALFRVRINAVLYVLSNLEAKYGLFNQVKHTFKFFSLCFVPLLPNHSPIHYSHQKHLHHNKRNLSLFLVPVKWYICQYSRSDILFTHRLEHYFPNAMVFSQRHSFNLHLAWNIQPKLIEHNGRVHTFSCSCTLTDPKRIRN